jgi:hypothetical protein
MVEGSTDMFLFDFRVQTKRGSSHNSATGEADGNDQIAFGGDRKV